MWLGLQASMVGNRLTQQWQQRLVAIVGLLILSSMQIANANKFYTIVDASGRLVTVPMDEVVQADEHKPPQPASKTLAIPAVTAAVTTPSPQPRLPAQPQVALPSDAVKPSVVPSNEVMVLPMAKSPIIRSAQALPAVKPKVAPAQQTVVNTPDLSKTDNVASQPTQSTELYRFDDVNYIDSQALIDKQFNLEGKKRFYSLPNNLGGADVVEREKGVNISQFTPIKASQQPQFSLSRHYLRLPQQQLTPVLGQACFEVNHMAKLKILTVDDAINLWPRKKPVGKFGFEVIKLEQTVNDISVMSYASSSKNPQFYWPLPVFLDNNGCVIEGVAHYFQQQYPATLLQHTALKGNLHKPTAARYLLLTPLVEVSDLPQAKLTPTGAISLRALVIEP